MTVVDAIVHVYNFSPDNLREGTATTFLVDALEKYMLQFNPGDRMPEDRFKTDWGVDALYNTVFRESQTDLAVTHHLPLYSWFHDGMFGQDQLAEVASRWPKRFITYAGVDPLQGVAQCIESLDRQLETTPGIVGLKLYPHRINPYEKWRLDDEKAVFPLIQHAINRGLRVIAIHKATPLGPLPLESYRVDDIDLAAMAFPEMSFEIVHAGMAFTEEISSAIARFPNVYANLETTAASMLLHRPKLFMEVLAQLMAMGNPLKIFWSTGNISTHPQPVLKAFAKFELSSEVEDKYQISLTRDLKRAILGENYASMIGLDLAQWTREVAGDEVDQARQGGHLDAPYSTWADEKL
jgi:predicted TIM-barrel fold metal-dependent hydrolase